MSKPRNIPQHVGPPRRTHHGLRGLTAFLLIWNITVRDWRRRYPKAPVF